MTETMTMPEVNGTTSEQRTEDVTADDLFKRAVILTVKFENGISRSRQCSTDYVSADAEKTLLRLSKRLLDCDAAKAITSLDNAIKKVLRTRALPSMFRAGAYLLPVSIVKEIDAYLREKFAERDKLVDAFIGAYEAEKAIDRDRLRELYNEGDYPSADEVREGYCATFGYATYGSPQSLKEIDPEIFDRSSKEERQKLQEAVGEIRTALRAGFLELVAHAADKLQPGPDGKRKVFRNSLVENLQEFLKFFDQRNVVNDESLQALVGQAKSILQNVSPDSLRQDADTRLRVLSGMQDIKSQLDGLLEEKPVRVFRTDEDL